MIDSRVPFGIGSRFVTDDVTWTVVELEGVRVTLTADGRHRCIDISALAESGKEIVIDGRPVENVLREVELIELNEDQREALELLRADLREFDTGYRSGSASLAAEGEPRHANRKVRAEMIAADRGVSTRQMYRRFKAMREGQGANAVVDGRTRRLPVAAPDFDERFLKVAKRMLKANVRGSTMTNHGFYIAVCAEVRNVHAGATAVPEPNYEAFRLWMSRHDKRANHFGKATTRRNVADAADADRHLGGHVSTRPGEVVVIDSDRVDFLARDPESGEAVQQVWTMALDLYCAEPIGLRITTGDPIDVDIGMLMSDVVRPRPRHTGGPCRFWGVPEQLIASLGDDWWVGEPADGPFVKPQAFLVDGGKPMLSKLVEDAAEVMQCDVMEAHPRTGGDKARLERYFGSIKTMYLQQVPGYKASSVADRGEAPENDELLLPDEHEQLFWEWVELIWRKRPHPGLRDPAFMDRWLTPREKYEIGIARAGFYCLPADPDLWLRMLPAKHLKVEAAGIRHAGLTYDCPELNDYRRDSRLRGADGNWRVRFDRRNIMWIWLEDHEEGTFLKVPWRHYREGDPLFGARALAYLKRILAAEERQALLRHTHATYDEALKEFVRRIRSREITLPAAQRVMRKALAEGRAAKRDADAVAPESSAVPAPVGNASSIASSETEESVDQPIIDMRDDGPATDIAEEDAAATSYRWM